jgi:hypothetical protein
MNILPLKFNVSFIRLIFIAGPTLLVIANKKLN